MLELSADGQEKLPQCFCDSLTEMKRHNQNVNDTRTGLYMVPSSQTRLHAALHVMLPLIAQLSPETAHHEIQAMFYLVCAAADASQRLSCPRGFFLILQLIQSLMSGFHAELRELFDMKIFVDTDADLRLARR